MYPVKVGGKWGYIDKSGKVIVEPQYDNAYGSCQNYAVVKKDSNYLLVNSKGEDISKGRQFSAGYINDNSLISAFDNRKLFGYVDSSGKVVIPFQFDYAGNFYGEDDRGVRGRQGIRP